MKEAKCYYCGQNAIGKFHDRWICRLCVDRSQRDVVTNPYSVQRDRGTI